MGLQLPGDVCQNEQQCQRDVPRAAQHGKVAKRLAAVREEDTRAIPQGEAQGQMPDYVTRSRSFRVAVSRGPKSSIIFALRLTEPCFPFLEWTLVLIFVDRQIARKVPHQI